MATVYIETRKRQKRNSYVIYYKHPFSGKNKYYKTLPKKREAQNEANKLRALLDTGKTPEEQVINLKPYHLTIEEVAENLSETWKDKLVENTLSPVTVDCYEVWLEQIKVAFKGKLVCEIRKNDISKFRQSLAKSRSNATANRVLFVIKQLFKIAIDHGVIFDDPSSDIKYLSEKVHKRNRYLLPHLIDCLVSASQQTRSKFYMPSLIYLGAEHGTSRQEALDLEWNHINFEYNGSGLISLYRQKNQTERTECLMPRTKQALLEWKSHLEFMRHRKQIQPAETRFVFCRLNGMPIKRFDSAWRNMCEIAGITDFHYHDLRHTFCSNLLLSGANIKDVKEMIGHSDISMTDRYSHIPSERHKAMLDQLAKHYGGYDSDSKL